MPHPSLILSVPAPCCPQNCLQEPRDTWCWCIGMAGCLLPHPGPLPGRGTAEAKPKKKLLRRLHLFLQATQVETDPRRARPVSPRLKNMWPSRRRAGAVTRMGLPAPARARMCTNVCTPCVQGLGLGPQGAHSGALYLACALGPQAEPWVKLPALEKK